MIFRTDAGVVSQINKGVNGIAWKNNGNPSAQTLRGRKSVSLDTSATNSDKNYGSRIAGVSLTQISPPYAERTSGFTLSRANSQALKQAGAACSYL